MTGGARNRRAGDYFERQCRATLRQHGWIVIRAAGSHGPADLVALRADKKPMLVSCKLNGYLRPQERVEFLAVAKQAGARGVVASRPKDGHVELAVLLTGGPPVSIDVLRAPKGIRT